MSGAVVYECVFSAGIRTFICALFGFCKPCASMKLKDYSLPQAYQDYLHDSGSVTMAVLPTGLAMRYSVDPHALPLTMTVMSGDDAWPPGTELTLCSGTKRPGSILIRFHTALAGPTPQDSGAEFNDYLVSGCRCYVSIL